MQRLLFDLVDLRLFANIAEAQSLTRGAERSCTSLAAASMRIKNVEGALGTKLFNRTSGGVTLTPAGEAMFSNALAILRQTERLHGDLLQYSEGLKGRIRMFANSTAMTEFLPPALGAFLASHPKLTVELEERVSDDIIRAVQDSAVDIGIVAGNVRTEGLQALPYQKDRLVLATSLNHPLAQCERIAFEEALDYDFVSLQAGSAIYAFMNRIVGEQGGTMSVRVQVSSFDALCRMVEANAGIGVLQRSAAMRHLNTTAIHVVELTNPWAERALKICVRDVDALPSFARELVEHLVETVPKDEASPA